MCGIAGFITNNELPEEKKKEIFSIISDLFVATQSRGRDASGFSYVNKYGNLTVVKGPVTSQRMVEDEKFKKLEKELPVALIAHCRAKTLGSELNNFNNHPLLVDRQISVIHNGMISNHVELKELADTKAKGSVDSEVIPMLIHKYATEFSKSNDLEKATKSDLLKSIGVTASKLEGGFACAMLNEKHPNTLYLFNHTNPIVLGYCEDLETIFFASTKDLLEGAIKKINKKMKHFNIFNIAKYKWDISQIDNDTMSSLSFTKKDNKTHFDIHSFKIEAQPKWANKQAVDKASTLNLKLEEKSTFYEFSAQNTPVNTSTRHLEDWEQATARTLGYN